VVEFISKLVLAILYYIQRQNILKKDEGRKSKVNAV